MYGFYKDVNEKRDSFGYIKTCKITENTIKFYILDAPHYPIEKPYKKDNSWFANSSVTKEPIVEFKIIDDKTIEIIWQNGTPVKWVKITDEEYQHIKNNPAKPEVKPFPKLF